MGACCLCTPVGMVGMALMYPGGYGGYGSHVPGYPGGYIRLPAILPGYPGGYTPSLLYCTLPPPGYTTVYIPPSSVCTQCRCSAAVRRGEAPGLYSEINMDNEAHRAPSSS